MAEGEAIVEGIEDIKYDEKGLVPAIVQEQKTGQVLMLAYMNRESLARTLETGRTWFYSRSRQELWPKGESSGHVQNVKKIMYDCDADTLLVQVEQVGAACHTGELSCFYRELKR
jgi:phosphoribosyl-AMP cyclohydrolase